MILRYSWYFFQPRKKTHPTNNFGGEEKKLQTAPLMRLIYIIPQVMCPELKACRVYRVYRRNSSLTMRWAMSISSRRARCTPWGSPSMRTSPQRSESWGIRTDTLYSSLIRFTERWFHSLRRVNDRPVLHYSCIFIYLQWPLYYFKLLLFFFKRYSLFAPFLPMRCLWKRWSILISV